MQIAKYLTKFSLESTCNALKVIQRMKMKRRVGKIRKNEDKRNFSGGILYSSIGNHKSDNNSMLEVN